MGTLTIQKETKMKKPVEIWQIILGALTFLAMLIGAWVTLNNKVSRIETKQEQESINAEFVRTAMEKKIDKIDDKMDKQGSDIRQILIEIQNKQDRTK